MTKNNPGLLAFLLIIGAVILRFVENKYPSLVPPGCTPFIALSFIGAAYLSHQWSWIVGAAAALASEFAFLPWNYQSDGHYLSPVLVFTVGFYLIMGVFGLQLSKRPSLWTLYGGPLLGSLAFYLLANTISWWASLNPSAMYHYPQTLAGWMQANTTGMPGYPPAWNFLRNSIVGDLVFTTLLIMIFDPAREFTGFYRGKSTVQA